MKPFTYSKGEIVMANKRVNKKTNNLRKTFKNKLTALILLLTGLIPLMFYQDATFLMFAAVIGIPLFFAKDEWIV